jgi:8-oxo-dGTP diphosphatase
MNEKIIKIASRDVQAALLSNKRQYFVGKLGLPQMLKHIDDSDVEIGISQYDKETYEKPHWHPIQKEYNYLLAGSTTYTEIITGDTYQFCEGDFYAISPGTCYEQKVEPGTQILFIKKPSVNDKTTCDKCIEKLCNRMGMSEL